MELKKGQKQGRDERTQEDYPTSAVFFGIIQAFGSFVVEPVHLAIYIADANIINLFEVATGFVYKR